MELLQYLNDEANTFHEINEGLSREFLTEKPVDDLPPIEWEKPDVKTKIDKSSVKTTGPGEQAAKAAKQKPTAGDAIQIKTTSGSVVNGVVVSVSGTQLNVIDSRTKKAIKKLDAAHVKFQKTSEKYSRQKIYHDYKIMGVPKNPQENINLFTYDQELSI